VIQAETFGPEGQFGFRIEGFGARDQLAWRFWVAVGVSVVTAHWTIYQTSWNRVERLIVF